MTESFVSTYVAGAALGLSLIVAIGAQNAFVLRQGLRREHVLAVCLTCALSDAVLITVGVAGFGAIGASVPWFEGAMRWFGAAFLAWYGARSLWRAWRGPDESLEAAERESATLGATLATTLALTWLNPHVYLDTVVLLGSIASQYERRLAFGAGAASASFGFFFALGYGARALAPTFANPRAWRVLDAVIGVTMWAIAIGLVAGSE